MIQRRITIDRIHVICTEHRKCMHLIFNSNFHYEETKYFFVCIDINVQASTQHWSACTLVLHEVNTGTRHATQSTHTTFTTITFIKFMCPNGIQGIPQLLGGACELDYYRCNNGLCPYTQTERWGESRPQLGGDFLYTYCDLQPLQPWPLRQGRTSRCKNSAATSNNNYTLT